MEKFLTVKEVADLLDRSEDTVRGKAINGELKGSKNSGSWLFLESDVQRFITGEKETEKSTVSHLGTFNDLEKEYLSGFIADYCQIFTKSGRDRIDNSAWVSFTAFETYAWKQLCDYQHELVLKYENPVEVYNFTSQAIEKYLKDNR